MRKIKIQRINSNAGTIEVAGNVVGAFQGRFYRHPDTGAVLPAFTTPPPAGHVLVNATTFDIIGNAKYSGRYTVYTPTGSGDVAASAFANSTTTIKVNERIPALSGDDVETLLTDGYITNMSTYLLDTGGDQIVVPPATDIVIYPVELMGRDSSGWGEAFNKNFINVARNFSSSNPPDNPFLGMTWYDTDTQQVSVWNGTGWDLVNRQSYGLTYRHTQSTPSKTWAVNHYLGFPAPYIGFCQFFVDRGDGPKVIIPMDVSFLNGNQLSVTFSNPEIGYVLVRQ